MELDVHHGNLKGERQNGVNSGHFVLCALCRQFRGEENPKKGPVKMTRLDFKRNLIPSVMSILTWKQAEAQPSADGIWIYL